MMKLVLLSSLLGVVVSGAETGSLSGKWQISRSAAGTERRQVCTFTQQDSDLIGDCSSDQGTVKISGKVDGKKVTFAYKTERDGSPLTVVYKGTLDSTPRITGTVSAVEFGIDGEFTATPSK